MSLSEARGYLSGYEVSWAVEGAGEDDYSLIQVTSDTSSYQRNSDNLLDVTSKYSLRVRASTGAGFGDYSSLFSLSSECI